MQQPSSYSDYTEISLADLFALIKRGLIPAIIAAAVIGVAALVISRQMDPVYEAKAVLVSSSPESVQREFGTTLVSATPLDTNAYRQAITSTDNVRAALQRAGDNTLTVREVQQAVSIRIEGSQSSALFHITVQNEQPAVAQALANALAERAVEWDQERATKSLDTIIGSIEGQLNALAIEMVVADEATLPGLERKQADLTVQHSTARALKAGAIGRLEILEQAMLPKNAVSPRPLRNAAIAAVLAIFLTYGVLLVREALDTRFRSADAVQDALNSPILAEFPKIDGPRRQIPREGANYLRTAVDLVLPPKADQARVIQVTSGVPEQGKTAVAIALAESAARRGKKTLLIDADLRKPRVAGEYHMQNGITLEQMLSEGKASSPYRLEIDTGITLDIVPTFQAAANPSEILSGAFKQVLTSYLTAYDLIIIDSAPVLPVADPLITAPHTDGVLFAVSLLDANRKDAIRAAETLRRVGAPILGVVLTNLPLHGKTGYGYGYGYGEEPKKA